MFSAAPETGCKCRSFLFALIAHMIDRSANVDLLLALFFYLLLLLLLLSPRSAIPGLEAHPSPSPSESWTPRG